MKRASKIFLTTLTAVVISVASVACVSAAGPFGDCSNKPTAMQGQGYDGGPGMGPGRGMGPGYGMHGQRGGGYGPMAGGTERATAHLAQLKQQLAISESQEPAWLQFEQQMQAKMAQRQAWHQQQHSGTAMTVADRIGQMRERSSDMAEMAAAMEALYTELSDQQRALFDQMGAMRFGRGR